MLHQINYKQLLQFFITILLVYTLIYFTKLPQISPVSIYQSIIQHDTIPSPRPIIIP